jgi:putative glycerol-1-phosphate prenyltransferase
MEQYQHLVSEIAAGKKKFAVLIDPDKCPEPHLDEIIKLSVVSKIDYFFIGGSLVINDQQDYIINRIKESTTIPVLLFPGNNLQLNNHADGILLLSLISGRNPDMLIGRHVISAPFLKASNLEILSTGYMLIESGTMTTVTYMSNTTPIPSEKKEIAVCTAMAGEMLGMKLIYMDAGSGAKNQVPAAMISAVKEAVKIPLIVGGGILSPEMAKQAFQAGADIVVVGNAIEQNPGLIPMIAEMR